MLMPLELNIQLKILDARLGNEIPLPTYHSKGAAGLDLRAMFHETKILYAEHSLLVPTGIAIHIADSNVAGILTPRSGLSSMGVILGNSIGVIDSDYQGQILVLLYNRSEKNFEVNPGDRIAQLLFMPIIRANWHVVEEFIPSDRWTNGFGSTGVL